MTTIHIIIQAFIGLGKKVIPISKHCYFKKTSNKRKFKICPIKQEEEMKHVETY